MIDDADLKPIAPTGAASTATASHIASGLPIAKTLRVQVFSPDDWELFTEEYASSLQASYAKVRRFGGSGDMGITSFQGRRVLLMQCLSKSICGVGIE